MSCIYFIELKPCPFCGAAPTFALSDVDEYGQAWDRLSCPSCYAYVERALEKDGSGSDVVERWNRRTDTRADALEGLLREARGPLNDYWLSRDGLEFVNDIVCRIDAELDA